MKSYLLLFAILFTSLPSRTYSSDASLEVQVSQDDFVFPYLDKSLVDIWLGSEAAQPELLRKQFTSVQNEWLAAKAVLLNKQVDHVNIPEFISRVESYLVSLELCIEQNNYSCIKSIAYHLIYEFRSLRQCMFKTEYSFDLLWEAIDGYLRVEKTIHDRMFDLKEWFEFEDDVNDFICKWEYYDLQHIQSIQKHFPGINKAEHNELKERVNSCIFTLLKSFESGFQSDFELPCDELGQAYKDLLAIYAKSRMNMLM